MTKKTAIILFNLGGPDSPQAVKPFLFNLFNDKAIITLPQPFRFLLAKLISGKREEEAKHIYAQIGGRSPILEETRAQADALEKKLGDMHRVFIAMRYWHPFAWETAKKVKEYDPDEIVLLPLYPHYSTTTTGSSVKDWRDVAKKAGIKAEARSICCYPTQEKFIDAHVELLRKGLAEASAHGTPRVLFSAHGLPEKIINAGDPYQKQVEATVAAVIKKFGSSIDHVVCYQSKVGPLAWIKPATDDEIRRAGVDKVPVVIVPIAFVSEHSETLVELDIQYKQLAQECGVSGYVCVKALGTEDAFIEALAALCLPRPETLFSGCGYRCPEPCSQCPCRK